MHNKLISGLICMWMVLSCAQVHASGYPAALGGPTPPQDNNDLAGPNTPDPKDDGSNTPPCGAAGGMIQLVNGSERFSITDLELKGLFPIRITRQYESRAAYDSALGFGWDFSFTRRLYTYDDPDKDVYTDTSKPYVYNVKHHVVRHGCGRKDLWISASSCNGMPDILNIVEGETVTGSSRVNTNLSGFMHDTISSGSGSSSGGSSGGSNGAPGGSVSICSQSYYKAFGTVSNVFREVSFREVSEGMVNYFDAEGRLTERRDEQGNAHRYTYDARGLLPLTGSPAKGVDITRPRVVSREYRLTHIEEYAADGVSTGNWVNLSYNETTGRLTQVTASDGRVVTYTHDVIADGLTLGNLLRVEAPGDKVSVYQYNDANDLHNITSIQEDANESPWVNTYNTDDRAIQQVRQLDDGRFSYINIEYPALYSRTVVRKSLRDSASAILPGTTETAETTWFDAQWMKPTAIENANGHCIKNVYDANGWLSSTDYYDVNCATANATATPVKSVEMIFDKYGRQLTEKIHLANAGYKQHDWLYTATEIGAASIPGGSVGALSDGSASNPGWERAIQNDGVTTKTAADIFYGNTAPSDVVSGPGTSTFGGEPLIDPTMSDNFFKKHLQNYILQKSGDATVTDQYDLVTQLNYDTKNRLQSVIQDGHEMRASYEAGALFPTRVAHINADTTEDPVQLTRYAYDARHNLSDVWDGNNNHTHYEYDARNRLINITNALGEQTMLTYTGKYLTQVDIGHTTAGEGLIRQFGYDGHGNLNHVTERDDSGSFQVVFTTSYDAQGHLLTATDGASHTWQYQYDNAGNLIREQDPELHITEHGYDAVHNRIWTRDAKLQLTNYGYDGAGRLTRIEQCGVAPCAVTTIEYDAMDRVTAVVDANNNRSTYSYDLAGRLREETGAKGIQQYSYDGRNRLVQWLNARGQKTELDYYTWGGLQSSTYYPDEASTTATRSVNWTYDNQGNPQSVTDDAVMASVLCTQNFDALNRLAAETHFHVPGKTISQTFNYDALGNIQTFAFNDGSIQTQTFHHNQRNWLDTATLLSTAYTFNYYNDGREQSRSQTSRTREHNYYSNGWLQNITDSVSSSAELTQGFTPDAVGNIEAINKLIGAQAETNSFGYDGLNRLTSATNPNITGLAASETYDYDATGNRLGLTYDAWNRINTALGKVYTYDADGNPDSIGGTTLSHDNDGRMTHYGTNEYVYDPEWRRIQKTTASGTRYYVWDGERLMAEYDQAGNRIARYGYLPNDFSPTEVEINNVVYQVRTDHLGTPLELVNAANDVVWRAHYESFGHAVIEDDVDEDGTPVEFNVRMPGQYFDQETGLSYNLHRYYDPQTGRYISSDPIGLRGGVNTYAYSLNNSQKYSDPDGLLGRVSAIGFGICTAANIYFNEISTINGLSRLLDESELSRQVLTTVNDSINQCPLEQTDRRQQLETIRDNLQNQMIDPTRQYLNDNGDIAGGMSHSSFMMWEGVCGSILLLPF